MKKKITFFTLHLGYGGVEKAVTTLVNELCDDYEIEIIATYKLFENPAFFINDKVSIKYLINNSLPLRISNYKNLIQRRQFRILLKSLWEDYKFHIINLINDTKKGLNLLTKKEQRNIKEIKNCKSDIIIGTAPYLDGLIGKYANKNSLKIGWEHSHHHNNKKYIKNLIKNTQGLDKLIVVSKSLANFYDEKMQCQVLYVSNFLNKYSVTHSSLNVNNIVTVGRLAEEKGVIDIVKTFKIISESNKYIKLNIIGDGPERNNIEKYIKKNLLEDRVIMHGYQSQDYINKIYEDSSIFLMGSYTESFGLVLAEAMNYGVPCIAFTSAEGANEVIQNGVNGYLINRRDHKKMAKYTLDLLTNEKKLHIMSDCAIRKSKKYYKNRIVTEWKKILEKNND